MACVKICITGPESSGKTTLAIALSRQLGCALVQEQARDFLLNLGREHQLSDLTQIANLQLKAESDAAKQNECIVCDTDLVTIKIWAEDKYQTPLGFVEENLKEQLADLYLVCFPDLPWQFDELREDEHRRVDIYDKYIFLLEELGADYSVIKGSGAEREKLATVQVNKFFNH